MGRKDSRKWDVANVPTGQNRDPTRNLSTRNNRWDVNNKIN